MSVEILEAAKDPKKVSGIFKRFITEASKAMKDSEKDAYGRFMETNLAHEYLSLNPEEVFMMLSVCAVESVNRAIGQQPSLVDGLPGVMDTWLLQRTRHKMDPASMVLVFSTLNALENLATTGDERTPESSYLQAFFDLVEFRGIVLDSCCDIYSAMGSTILTIAPGVTFGYVHPDFKCAPKVPEDDRLQLEEYWTRRVLKKEGYEDLLEEFEDSLDSSASDSLDSSGLSE
ncbi:hypothetical protein VTG60DRAFT_3109 [Thermothelomyces hinnuleus]